MIELIAGLPEGVVGVEAKGEVTAEDYERVLIPAVEEALEAHEKIGFLYVLGPQFDDISAGAMWDDAKVGIGHPFSWERIAVVTDHDTYRRLFKGVGFLMPAEVKVFAVADLDEAKAWVGGSG